MKKVLAILVVISGVLFCGKIHAASDGYIVKVKENSISLMFMNDKVVPVGEDLYRTETLEDVYSYFAHGSIDKVFPDYQLELFDVNYPESTSDTAFDYQWYLEQIGAADIRDKGLSGKGVKIAVIDSGVNADHPDFRSDTVLSGYNCIAGAADPSDCSDNIGHGTMVAGIIAAHTDNELDIAGIASGAQIVPIKITDTSKLNLSNVFNGLEKAIQAECDIINMSFGGVINNAEALSVLKEYIDEAEEKGIIVVTAVGNSGHTDNAMNYPAGFDNVIGVGAIDEDLTVSYFSQRNSSVFITAPGNNIVSLSNTDSLMTGLGTSFSTPIVTAVVAIIKEVYPDYSLKEVKELLIKTSVDSGDKGYDTSYGYGILDASAIVEDIKEQIPEFMISKGSISSQPRVHIHNNTDKSVVGNAFFSSYQNGALSQIDAFDSVSLKSGTTSITYNSDYEYFFLWNNKLRPYINKYSLK